MTAIQTPELPSKEAAEQAEQYLANEIFVPSFFEKLAQHGIQPTTRAEVSQLLEMGVLLQQAEEQGTFKAASTEQGNAFLTAAIEKLSSQQEPASTDEIAAAVVQGNEMAKSAALLFNHIQSGGKTADDPPETETQE